MFCPKCGKDVEEDAKFCGHCGYELESAKKERKGNNKTSQIGFLFSLIGGIIVMICGSISMLFVLTRYEMFLEYMIQVSNITPPYGLAILWYLVFGIIMGILMIIGGYLGFKGKNTKGGILVILSSLLALLSSGGLLLGTILGLIGGILLLLRREG